MKTVKIDCKNIKTAQQFHQILAENMGFEDYYGHNLDALFDCLTDICEDTELVLHNWHFLEYALKDYSGKAVYVFHCACEENPFLTVTLHP